LLFQVNIKSTAEGIFVGAGFCASFAGIMFVLDNLTLQRKSLIKQSLEIAYTRVEVKQSIEELEEANSYYEEQNKLMKFQQNENTFFTLIDLHRKLYNELNIDDKPAGQVQKEKLMERLQNDVNNKGNHYTNCIIHKQFPSFEFTKYNPKFYFSEYPKTKDKNLEMYIENVKDIIQFIHTNLDNSGFYHKKFYNLLFPIEKYLVGMCQTLDVYNFYSFCTDETQRFNYSEFYDSLITYSYKKKYVPALQIELFGFIPNSSLEILKNKNFNYKISILENKYKETLVLASVNANILHNDVPLENIELLSEPVEFADDELIVDFIPVIEKIQHLKISKKIIGGTFTVLYTYTFNYINIKYTVVHNEIITFSNDRFNIGFSI
jgi:hypothetical protein